jgi:hypothetical protein
MKLTQSARKFNEKHNSIMRRLSVLSVSIAAAGVIVSVINVLVAGDGKTTQSTAGDCSAIINKANNTNIDCRRTIHKTQNSNTVNQTSYGDNSPLVNNSSGVYISR